MPTTYTVIETGITANVDETGNRSYTRRFVVKVTAAVSSLDVLQGGQVADPPLPRFGQVMVTRSGTPDGSAVCIGLDVTQRSESVYLWDVVATYSSRVRAAGSVSFGGSGAGSSGGGKVPAASGGLPAAPDAPQDGGAAGGSASTTTPSIIENPLARPAKYSFSSVRTQEILEFDLDGNKVVNSANYPFDPPVRTEMSHSQLVVTKNMPITTVVASWIRTYVNSINKTAFRGYPAKTLKLSDISATSENENNIWFWAMTFTFEEKIGGWNPVKILDAGWYDSTGKEIRTNLGNTPGTVPLLNGSGSKLAGGSTPVFEEFTVYYETEFSNLGLF